MSWKSVSDEQFMDLINKLQTIVDTLQTELYSEFNFEADENPNFNLDENTEPNIQVDIIMTRNIQKEYLENMESSTAQETELFPEEEKSLIFNPDLSMKLEQSIHSNLQVYKLFAWETEFYSEAEESLNFNLVWSMRLEQSTVTTRNMQGGCLESSALETSASRDRLTEKQLMNP